MRLALTCLITLLILPVEVAAQRPDRPPPVPTIPSQRRSGVLVRGRVLPRDRGVGLPEIMTVTLTGMGGGFRKTELVRSGRFRIESVPFGDYIIRLESEGFETVEQRVDLQNPSASMQHIQLSLGAPLGAGTRMPGPKSSTVGVESLMVPDQAMKYLEKASRAGKEGKSERAIKMLQKAIEIYPEFHQAYNNLAVQCSIELEPTALAYRNLGLIHLRKREYDLSVAQLRLANDMDPSDQQTVQSLGEAYFGLGQYQVALGWLKIASKMDENPVIDLAMGHCHLRLGDYDSALSSFENFLSSSSHHPQRAEVRKLIKQIRQVQQPQ